MNWERKKEKKKHMKRKCLCGCVCAAYLSRRLYAQNSHPCLRIVLEAVDQLDPLCRRNAAIDSDITGLRDETHNTRTFQLTGSE